MKSFKKMFIVGSTALVLGAGAIALPSIAIAAGGGHGGGGGHGAGGGHMGGGHGGMHMGRSAGFGHRGFVGGGNCGLIRGVGRHCHSGGF